VKQSSTAFLLFFPFFGAYSWFFEVFLEGKGILLGIDKFSKLVIGFVEIVEKMSQFTEELNDQTRYSFDVLSREGANLFPKISFFFFAILI
jgi:hypothetical protein